MATGDPARVGLKGAGGYANPDDGEPNAVRRTSLDERSEADRREASMANGERSEP
jgi:hypothetical protein